MANSKSSRPRCKPPLNKSAKCAEMIDVPILVRPYSKAPPSDPYLRPESVTSETLTFGDTSLPPILSGVQPGLDLKGKPKDHQVKVMWASRRQIEEALEAVEKMHPDTGIVMKVVRSFMCSMDSIRDSALHVNLSAQRAMQDGRTDAAAKELASLREVFGRWDDERRLHIW